MSISLVVFKFDRGSNYSVFVNLDGNLPLGLDVDAVVVDFACFEDAIFLLSVEVVAGFIGSEIFDGMLSIFS